MWFVARCLKGLDPPLTLAPEMVPPSFRTTKPSEGLVVSSYLYFFYGVTNFLPKNALRNTYANVDIIITIPASIM